MAELNPLLTGTTALAMTAALTDRLISKNILTIAEGRAVTAQAVSMIADHQRDEATTILKAALPGLF